MFPNLQPRPFSSESLPSETVFLYPSEWLRLKVASFLLELCVTPFHSIGSKTLKSPVEATLSCFSHRYSILINESKSVPIASTLCSRCACLRGGGLVERRKSVMRWGAGQVQSNREAFSFSRTLKRANIVREMLPATRDRTEGRPTFLTSCPRAILKTRAD